MPWPGRASSRRKSSVWAPIAQYYGGLARNGSKPFQTGRLFGPEIAIWRPRSHSTRALLESTRGQRSQLAFPANAGGGRTVKNGQLLPDADAAAVHRGHRVGQRKDPRCLDSSRSSGRRGRSDRRRHIASFFSLRRSSALMAASFKSKPHSSHIGPPLFLGSGVRPRRRLRVLIQWFGY